MIPSEQAKFIETKRRKILYNMGRVESGGEEWGGIG